MEERDFLDTEEILSKVLRAGRRAYLFGIGATRVNDYYLTIIESKKFIHDDGSLHYKKHKIYLCKEGFGLLRDILNEMTTYMFDGRGEEVVSERHQHGFKRKYYAEGLNEIGTTPSRSYRPLDFEGL